MLFELTDGGVVGWDGLRTHNTLGIRDKIIHNVVDVIREASVHASDIESIVHSSQVVVVVRSTTSVGTDSWLISPLH